MTTIDRIWVDPRDEVRWLVRTFGAKRSGMRVAFRSGRGARHEAAAARGSLDDLSTSELITILDRARQG